MIKKLTSLASCAALAAVLAVASSSAQAVNCAIPSQRDATCVGSTANVGALPASNAELSTTLRGSNAVAIAGVPIPTPDQVNSCIAVPFVAWAYDPVSYGTPVPSFVAQTSSGYLGSGGPGSPTDACSSDSDGSCAAWVPASYPYLFLGGSNFVQCAGSSALGSISCPVSGSAAYVTTNPSAGGNFTASMIACKNNTVQPTANVNGAPFSWWSSCSGSAYCSFYMVYPPSNDGG